MNKFLFLETRELILNMSFLFDSFAYKCLKIISFRSKTFAFSHSLNLNSTFKMSATLEQLKLRSAQANQVIEKLKKQVELIKLQTTPAYMAEKAKTLQKENDLLKKRVEELKKELELAESKKGPAISGTTAASIAPVVKAETKKPEASDGAKVVPKTATPKTTTPKVENKKTESKFL